MILADAIECFDIRPPYNVLIGMAILFGILLVVGLGCRKYIDKEEE